jgi:hypothetical protein
MKITELVPFSEFTSNRALRKLQTAHLARLDHEGGSFKEIRITTRYGVTTPNVKNSTLNL